MSFLSLLWCGLIGATLVACAACAAEVTVECSRVEGAIRPLHGVNVGPLHAGDTVDLSDRYRELGVPLTRLHDCHWPSADVVDIHVVFPDFSADPNLPSSYNFQRTDAYVQSILDTGSGIVFRLGESIEHTQRKYHVHPPADPAHWAAICVGIIRHYNEGWSNGFHHGIRYWEIWNEPENRPAMWTGSDEDYFRLYAAAAKAIKGHFPDVFVGGPAAGYVGQMNGASLVPSPFIAEFLARCQRETLPLDFFSWHIYTNDPAALLRQAHAIRRTLDERGFPRAESHLNEWNYLPDNDWTPLLHGAPRQREAWFGRLRGAEGAAFIVTALIGLQEAPVNATNFYSADTHGFGAFNEYGVPCKSFHALRAFRMLLDTPGRLRVDGEPPEGVVLAAGIDRARTCVTVLSANSGTTAARLQVTLARLPWTGSTIREIRVLDADHDLAPGSPPESVPPEPVGVACVLAPRSVLVARFRPGEATQ